jgi:uncharacterized lipoprotein YddW (UPF0748 family)
MKNRRRWWLALALLGMLAGVILRGDARPGRAQTPSDFETLAGQMGRAEAWYALHETTLPTATVATVVQPAGSITLMLTHTVHLPLIAGGAISPPMVERRAIWVTRYDWTSLYHPAQPETVDLMVATVAEAGFNTIFFQVRAAGDAYYAPGLEPWASRLTNSAVATQTLGHDPGWDPLTRMLTTAHAAGLEVHAYVNVYPAWLPPPNAQFGALAPPATTPPQMFDRFTYGPDYAAHPGELGLGYTWRQYSAPDAPMPLAWREYLWASPGVDAVQAHVEAVVEDLVTRYPVDGIHLDLVRYAGRDYSRDPFSEAATGTLLGPQRADWQRARVTALVRAISRTTHAQRPGAWVSAAVWPYYKDDLGLSTSSGYDDYYQDSQGWLSTGALDAIAPMLYGSGTSLPDDLATWELLMTDFVAANAGGAGHVYPGIAGYYEDFAAIAARIAAARAAAAPGHAIFSYGALNAHGHWDDFPAGPYAIPAVPSVRE